MDLCAESDFEEDDDDFEPVSDSDDDPYEEASTISEGQGAEPQDDREGKIEPSRALDS
jgi:hypothetical protein